MSIKRQEKNLQSKNKIVQAALKELASQGYGMSSINTICSEGGISKGVLYHYFQDKDEIYLTCIKHCFDTLTAFLRENVAAQSRHTVQDYFDARLAFFKDHPQYQRLFCEAVISPPPHLKSAINAIKADFDALNLAVLTDLLKGRQLRDGIGMEQAIEVFRLFQDFVNARYQMQQDGEFDPAAHEEICSRSLNILLYGVVEQEGNSYARRE